MGEGSRKLSTQAGPAPVRWRDIPWAALAATITTQALATMAIYAIPAVARDLDIPGEFSSLIVAAGYGFGVTSALGSPDFIHRHGAVRVSQVAMLCAIAMLLAAASGSLLWLALAPFILGLGYGANAPASTHILAPRTPRPVFNLVMSVRQIGVPLGGVLAATILPPLTLLVGWQWALLAELPALIAVILLIQTRRADWDADRKPAHRINLASTMRPFALLREDARIRVLSIACFCYSGISLTFVALTTVHLTRHAGLDLVRAGQMLAAYQLAGTLSRPVWGWIADRFLSPARTLALHGLGMGLAAIAAGQIGPGWSQLGILAVAIAAGVTAGGYTGVAYAEYARLGGARRTEATGLGTAIMFVAVLVLPPIIGALALALGNYAVPYLVLTVLALPCFWLLWRLPKAAAGG